MYRICIVTTVPTTLSSFVMEWAKDMVQTGDFEIHFVCDRDDAFAASLPEEIHYHPIAMTRGISLGGFKAAWNMYRLFKKEKFDLVQYSTPNAACYASIAARMAGIKVRLYCQWGIVYVGFQGLKRRIFKLIEKMICRNSTIIEPDSFGNLHFSHAEALYTPEKSRVIWNGSASGVNLSKFNVSHKDVWSREIRDRFGIPRNACVFVFVGRITRDKGINELFEASQRLLARYTDVYLLLVGRMDRSESILPELYDWSQNEPRVIYAGYTNEVEKYLAASDVYILPSYREGFGSAVIEAEAMGLPVIVTNIPGPTDAMKKDITGLVVEKANVTELLDAMGTLYFSSELRSDMGHRAVDFARNGFEQKKLFEQIHDDRLSLIEQSKKPKK